jgi:protein gp37
MENTKIQWTEATWNPWHGCQKVSPGCKFCYMYRDKERYGQDATTVLRSKTMFKQPLKWEEPKIIFTCSWSDWFIEEADQWRDEAWEIIQKTPQHTYQILTKRPERIEDHLPDFFNELQNVWIGVSVESQQQVDRIAYLNDLPCITFASFEPLIGEIDWNENMDLLDWCIIGGESGNDTGRYRYRPMELEWVEKLVKNAQVNNVKCFVKQLGTYQSKLLKLKARHGGDIDEWDSHFQIRQFPR